MICPQCLRTIDTKAIVSGADEVSEFMGYRRVVHSEPSGVTYRAYNGRMVESSDTWLEMVKGNRYMHKDCPAWEDRGVHYLHFYVQDGAGQSERMAIWRKY